MSDPLGLGISSGPTLGTVSNYNSGGFYPGTTVPMSAIAPPAPIDTSPAASMGMGMAPVNNINGGMAPTASFNAFTASPPQPSFNAFSGSPTNLTGIPQRTTSGFNPTFIRGSFPTMSPTMSGPYDQPSYEPPPTEGSFSGQSFTPTNSFVDNPYYGGGGGTSSGFGGTQVASLEPSIGFGTNPFTNGNVSGGIQSFPYPGVTGGIQPAPQDFGFGSGGPPLPRSNPLGPYNAGMGTIQPAPQDFGFNNPGNLPPLPPTNPLGPYNAGMGSIQEAPTPTPMEGAQPRPAFNGFFTPPTVTPPPFDFSGGSGGLVSAPTYNGQPMSNAQQYMAAQRGAPMAQLNNSPQQMTGLQQLGSTEMGSQFGGPGGPGQTAFQASRFNMANLGNQIDPTNGYNFFNQIPNSYGGYNNEFHGGPNFAGPDYGNYGQAFPNYPGVGSDARGHYGEALPPQPQSEMNAQQQAIYNAGYGGFNPGMTPSNPLGQYVTGNASGTMNGTEGINVNGERFLMEGNTPTTRGAYFTPQTYAQQYSNAAQFVPGGLGPGAPTGGNFAAITSPGFGGFTTSQQPPVPYSAFGGFY